MKLSIVSYFAVLRCQSTLLPRVDAAAARTGVAPCLLATSGDATRLAPLAGWLRLIEQCQKAHFHVLGRKWSPWDERGSAHTCTDPELQFCTVAGVMSLIGPQKMSHVLLVIKVFPMHWAALVEIHWRPLIIIMEYSGTLNTVTYRGEWVLVCLGLQEWEHVVLVKVTEWTMKLLQSTLISLSHTVWFPPPPPPSQLFLRSLSCMF